MHTTKAQAAFEFLMTYGWALLMTLVAISALVFFGVINPGRFLPDSCIMFAGFTCTDSYASSSSDRLKLTFQNGLGYTMSFTGGPWLNISVVVDGASLAGVRDVQAGLTNCARTPPSAPSFDIGPGFSVVCSYDLLPQGIATSTSGTKLKGSIVVTWTDTTTNVLRTRTGSLAATVET